MASPIAAASPPPPGVTPNFDHPESNAHALHVVNAVCLVVAVMFVALRIFTRFAVVKSLGWDDYTCVLGLVLTSDETPLDLISDLRADLGVHHRHIYPRFCRASFWTGSSYMGSAVQHFLAWLSQIPYTFAIFFIKFSILLLYLRIFSPSRYLRWAIWMTTFFVFGYCIAGTIIAIFPCRPQRRFWDPTTPGVCVDFPTLALAGCAFNIITDFIILVLPTREVWRLNLPARQRLALLGIFATGSLVCVATIVRLKFVTAAARDGSDLPWEWTYVSIWSHIELSLGLVSSCMAPLKPLVRKVAPSLLGSSKNGAGSSGGITMGTQPSVVTATTEIEIEEAPNSFKDIEMNGLVDGKAYNAWSNKERTSKGYISMA
ncbi:MAG: hypothetical protein M1816_007665 [Peltula sp. TS41687]|nr:MAG: hypothetical protein M1816_007665 [Peltula sp. TS41687]